MNCIGVAVIGVGNCTSSLIQRIVHDPETDSARSSVHEVVRGHATGDEGFVMAADVNACLMEDGRVAS